VESFSRHILDVSGEQAAESARAVNDVKDFDSASDAAIVNDVVSDAEAPHSLLQIIPSLSHSGRLRQLTGSVPDASNEPICRFDVVLGDVQPDFVEISDG
jgi:hypothetical protein